LARTHDHAEAALTHRDTPSTPIQDRQNAEASAGQVKKQAKSAKVASVEFRWRWEWRSADGMASTAGRGQWSRAVLADLGDDPNVDDVHRRRLIVYFVENPDLTGV
jgi:hypothetical protein